MAENRDCAGASSCSRESCEGCPSKAGAPQSMIEELNPFSSVKRVIGVVSGKGGVGKSFVTASLAAAMGKKDTKWGFWMQILQGLPSPKCLAYMGRQKEMKWGCSPFQARMDPR